MPETTAEPQHADVHAENIGGITEADAVFEPGVTVLAGRNATNRTSLLRAINAALGGSKATLKTDAEEGLASIVVDGEEYEVTVTESGTSTMFKGTGYADDIDNGRDIVDLYVTLTEDNDIRRSIERGGENLRDLLMAPVDDDRIRRQREEVQREKKNLEDKLSTLENKKARLPDLEEDRTSLQNEIETIEDELAEVKAKIEEINIEKKETREAQELLSTRNDKESELKTVRNQIEKKENLLEELPEEKAELEEELAELQEDGVEGDISEIDDKISRLSDQVSDIEEFIRSLNSLIEIMRATYDPDASEGFMPEEISVEEEMTAQLAPSGEQVECLMCGTETVRSDILDQHEDLQEMRSRYNKKETELKEEIKTLRNRKKTIRNRRQEIEETKTEIAEVEQEIAETKEEKAELKERKADLEEEIEDLQERVEETEELRDTKLPELDQERSELQRKLGRKENELEDVEADIEQIEAEIEEIPDLEDEIADLTDEIEELAKYIEDLEKEIVNETNDRLEEVLGMLEYENVDRAWVERKVEGAGKNKESTFDLHIIRAGGRESTVETLSESEREVIGLVMALSAYKVHDVHEQVPFMLLDSLEAIDANRIAELIDYFSEDVPYVIASLLPEDAEAQPDKFTAVAPDSFMAV